MKGKTNPGAVNTRDLANKALVNIGNLHRDSLVIIPTYNEAGNLRLLVSRILREGSFDILIVDDNSPDGTGEVAEKLAKRFTGRVIVLHRLGKLGLGTAYVDGFHYALETGYQWVFTMDADLSHDPSRLPILRHTLDDADVVLGSRYMPGGGMLHWPFWRRALSQSGSAYARLMLGLPVRDLTGGFKGFRRQVLEALIPDLDTIRSNGYAFQIEMTYHCSRHGFRIVEVPILFKDRLMGKSKMNWRIIAEALWIIWALRLSHMSSRAQIAVRRLAVVALAVAVLAIIFGTASTVPRLYSHLVQGASERSASVSHVRLAPPIGTRSVPSRSATRPENRAASAFLELQGVDLTPNVPLRFAGSGFLPGEGLAVTIQGPQEQLEAQLTPISADQAGQISTATETIPADLVPGAHTLLVEGQRSHRLAQATFQLHWIPPAVELDTYTVKPEHDFGFSGSGFLPNELVEVRLGSPTGKSLAAVSANAGGNVTGRILVPLMAAGNYSLFFMGRQSQTPTSVGLNVQGFHPWVVLDTYAPSPQARLGFQGEDFAPGEEVLVYLNQRGGESIVHLRADASGRFTVPAAWQVGELRGEQVLIFVGQQSGVVVTATFTVVP